MATRSTLAVVHNDGTVSQVYCHWDGGAWGVGDLLNRVYTTQDQVESLIAGGDISSLGETIGTRHPFSANYNVPGAVDQWNQLYGEMTTYYGRDRGETDVLPREFKNVEDYETNYHPEEYNYLFIENNWYVRETRYTDTGKSMTGVRTVAELVAEYVAQQAAA